jgi:hypothetical protein
VVLLLFFFQKMNSPPTYNSAPSSSTSTSLIIDPSSSSSTCFSATSTKTHKFMEDKVEMEGILKKQGEKVENWKARYFVLDKEGVLTYYQKSKHATKVTSPSIPLLYVLILLIHRPLLSSFLLLLSSSTFRLPPFLVCVACCVLIGTRDQEYSVENGIRVWDEVGSRNSEGTNEPLFVHYLSS